MTEPLIALVFILAPFVLGFDSDTATTLSIVLGVIVLLTGLTTRWRLSVMKLIPLRMHFMADVLVGIVAIAAPFVLGFSDETAPTVFFVVMGVGELLAAFGTAWTPERDVAGTSARSRGGSQSFSR